MFFFVCLNVYPEEIETEDNIEFLIDNRTHSERSGSGSSGRLDSDKQTPLLSPDQKEY